jgi:epoxyqueuosine reductase
MISDSQAFKENLRTYALELGFLDLRVAEAVELEQEYKSFENWLSQGLHADMAWLDRNKDKRRDIKKILDNARSVIVLSYSYFTGIDYPPENQIHGLGGKISRYAWGDDYHDVIPDKLNKIISKINEKEPESQNLAYVDTGPILEKQWAVRSGLGWQGKNSLILASDYGSYFFIGIIISSIEMPVDDVVSDRCGTCTKCIKACPTDAIIADAVIDSRKCISYWTIEAKYDKEIPQYVSAHLNNWLFGCDICQEVCPWNKNKPKLTDYLGFQPRQGQTTLSHSTVAEMEQVEFTDRFRKSPVKRLKLQGLKRNSLALKKSSEQN